MVNHAGTHQAPDDNVKDGDSEVGVKVAGDIDATGNDPEDLTSVRKNEQRQPLAIFPVLLGTFICALNIFVAYRLWKFLINSRNLGIVPLTLITISFLIGLLIIVYAIVLRRLEDGVSGQAALFVKWVIAPAIVALLASAVTLWAAGVAQPDTPEPVVSKPCMELYRDALDIRKDNPTFRLPANDPDQRRCKINAVLG